MSEKEMVQKGLRGFHNDAMKAFEKEKIAQAKHALSTKGFGSITMSI